MLGQPSELNVPRKVLLHFAGRSSVVAGECGEGGDRWSWHTSPPSAVEATPDTGNVGVLQAMRSRALTERGVDCADAPDGTAALRIVTAPTMAKPASAKRGIGGPEAGGPCCTGETPPIVGVAGDATPLPSSRGNMMGATRGTTLACCTTLVRVQGEHLGEGAGEIDRGKGPAGDIGVYVVTDTGTTCAPCIGGAVCIRKTAVVAGIAIGRRMVRGETGQAGVAVPAVTLAPKC